MDAEGKPPWCGICDQRTRLVGVPGGCVARCQECHPLARQHLKQHRRCQACKVLVYEWDNAPCGSHSSPEMKGGRLPRERIDEIVAAGAPVSREEAARRLADPRGPFPEWLSPQETARRQVAESRADRVMDPAGQRLDDESGAVA